MEADIRLLVWSFGIILVAWIGIDALKRRRQSAERQRFEAMMEEKEAPVDPLLEDDAILSRPRKVTQSSASPKRSAPQKPAAPSAPASKTKYQLKAPIGLMVKAVKDNGFQGQFLHTVLEQEALCWDEKGLYHRHKNNDPSAPCYYTIAQSVEPGFFSTASRYQQQIPGIILVMQPAKDLPVESAFDDLLMTCQRISQKLKGKMCRLDGQALTISDIQALQEQITAPVA